MIKKLDPLHMVTLGDEGWFAGETGKAYSGMANWTYHADWQDPSYAYAGVEGIDFVQNLMIPTLDYGTFHLYPDSWKYNETWGNTWISQHDDAGRKANKPVIFEEYGTEADKRTVIGEWQQTVLKTNVAADQWWQFSTDLPSGINVFDIHVSIYAPMYPQRKLLTSHRPLLITRLKDLYTISWSFSMRNRCWRSVLDR